MTRRHWQLLLAAGTAAGLVAGWLRPVSDPDAVTGRTAAAWSLPPAEALERSSAEQFAATRGLRWLGDAGTTEQARAAVTWTLRGVLPSEAAILVQTGSDPLIKRVRTGDTLPDGSRLVDVGRDAAVLERDGCRSRRELYPRPDQQDTNPEDPACTAAGAEQDLPTP